MDIKRLISMSRAQAEELLQKEDENYTIEYTSGGKDTEILSQIHVVKAVREKDKIILTVTGFKTDI
ncbi:MAG: hypothetical protein WBH44_04085 [Proteocatella sp.]